MAITHLEFFWIEQLLFDLLQSGLLHCLLCHWTHGILHTNTRNVHHPNASFFSPCWSFNPNKLLVLFGFVWLVTDMRRMLTLHLYLKPSISSILNSYGFRTQSDVSKKTKYMFHIKTGHMTKGLDSKCIKRSPGYLLSERPPPLIAHPSQCERWRTEQCRGCLLGLFYKKQ